MKIYLNKVGDFPSYKKIFGYVLTYKSHAYDSPEYKTWHKQIVAESGQSKFSQFVAKCLKKLFPECEVNTKEQIRRIYYYYDKSIIDRYI